MKATSVISEAWRSITSGAARLAPAVLALSLTTAGLGVMDIAAGAAILDQANAYRQSGADILVLNAPDGIDAASCERLTSLTGVQAAGAIRETDPITLAALPDTTTPLYQITPGLAKLLNATKTTDAGTGLIASQQVADTLGVAAGGSIGLADGRTAHVKGVYRYPDDGRTPGYAYALMEETPATGTFDACWAKTWPQTSQTRNALWSTLTPTAKTSGDDAPTLGQLNTTKGDTFDGQALYRQRATRILPACGALIALAIGVMLIRARRLEIASALHCGVPKPALVTQIIIETGITILLVAVISTPIDMTAAKLLTDATDRTVITLNAIQTLATVSTAYLLATTAATLHIKERHLFTYFKER
ncbi:hypothetical protein JS533_010610 [Bifidobacterium amazonense]|uniref:ABC transporter permease n=1 Tax=Bifidobacterium amazonense TaxID=2809027 RepID=A0ABS9VX77_9BIFI|nr:hypothetical protein [Bifidobacterium amazonense]MCH9276717.1 hypothetical protein [Bifidobacterium amazonense]